MQILVTTHFYIQAYVTIPGGLDLIIYVFSFKSCLQALTSLGSSRKFSTRKAILFL